jgi:hypothetical protein
VSQADEDISPLPPEEQAAWLRALEAALRPGELSAAVNERLIEMALEDPLAAPSIDELVESERLRRALDEGGAHEDAALLGGLRESFDPAGADDAVARALERALPRASQADAAPPIKPRGNVIYAIFGAGGALAAAAAILLMVTQTRAPQPSLAVDDRYVRPRSTAALFNERFETGDTTARMDLIASSRSRDLRDNRYAAWGVR